jgi:hypothetical protein
LERIQKTAIYTTEFPREGVGSNVERVLPLVVCIDLSPEPGMAFSFYITSLVSPQ